MKKRIFAALCMSLCIMGSVVPTMANNHNDTALPSKFVSYTAHTNTGIRTKMDDTSVYINNKSGFDLWVYIRTGRDDINQTYGGHADVRGGEWLMHNTVYEHGYRSCYLDLSTTKTSVSGKTSGYWSPDSVGSYPYANPF